MLLIKHAELDAHTGNTYVADVRCRNGLIVEIGSHLLPRHNEKVIDAAGSALIPGLHDHHIHLLALAAAQTSVDCGPPAVNNPDELREVLKKVSGDSWIRGVQYHESVAGELDRWQLDQWISDRPLRIQHRSGILWILNSSAIEKLQLDKENHEGLERNYKGELTGRIFRLDQLLRDKIIAENVPDLSGISCQLSRYGITGITDASANNDSNSLQLFETALAQGCLRQRVVIMGTEALPVSSHPMIKRGPVKLLLDEFQLPEFNQLYELIQRCHRNHRPVAFHCVTDAQLVFALSALLEAGPLSGDRIEHASLCPDELFPLLKKTGVAVVTQPGLLQSRGSQYQDEVPASQHNILYRCHSFLRQGIPLALSSDAPYGELNPWRNMQAAIKRCNSLGYVFGPSEVLTTEQALQTYLRDPVNLHKSRQVAEGAQADLCLLSTNWGVARKHLDDIQVIATIVAGLVIAV